MAGALPIPKQSNDDDDDDPQTQCGIQQQEERSTNVTEGDDGVSELYDWQAMIPSLVSRRGFACTEQSMDSARSLFDAGQLGNFTRANENNWLSPEVEASLLESFIEDDYEGALHLTTLDDDQGHPVGIVFWREVPEDEMEDWIHWENLQQRLLREQQEQQQRRKSVLDDQQQEGVDEPKAVPTSRQNHGRRMRQSLQLVREESIRWLEVASNVSSTRRASSSSMSASLLDTKSTAKLVETLVHSWVKIELLAVHPDYWNRHIGTLLLACAMYHAHKKGDDHMILHVAGGQENVPALKLYDKFGFLPVPQSTGVFRKPNKDLFLLGHVGRSLQKFCWPALEM